MTSVVLFRLVANDKPGAERSTELTSMHGAQYSIFNDSGDGRVRGNVFKSSPHAFPRASSVGLIGWPPSDDSHTAKRSTRSQRVEELTRGWKDEVNLALPAARQHSWLTDGGIVGGREARSQSGRKLSFWGLTSVADFGAPSHPPQSTTTHNSS